MITRRKGPAAFTYLTQRRIKPSCAPHFPSKKQQRAVAVIPSDSLEVYLCPQHGFSVSIAIIFILIQSLDFLN